MLGEFYFNINNITFKMDTDIIAVGHIGCIRGLPDKESLLKVFKLCKNNNKILRLYTPRIPQEHMNSMQEYISSLKEILKDLNFQIVINDIGLLLWIHENNIVTNHIVLGCTYSWSPMQNMLYDNMMRDERESIKEIFSQVNNNNSLRLQFFKELNVKEIEVPNIHKVLVHTDKIKKASLGISVFERYMLAGYSRVCVNMKSDNTECISCKMECLEVMKVDMESIWDYNSGKLPYFVKDDKSSSYYQDLYIQGNIQFKKIPQILKGRVNQLRDKDSIIKICDLDNMRCLNE